MGGSGEDGPRDEGASPSSDEPAGVETSTPSDPALAAVDEEFAQLQEELDRITTMPQGLAAEPLSMLDAVTRDWKEKSAEEGHSDEKKARIEEMIMEAMRKMLLDNATADMEGKLSFDMSPESLQQHAGPVMKEIVSEVQEQLQTVLQGLAMSVMAAQSQVKKAAEDAAGQAARDLGKASAREPEGARSADPGDAQAVETDPGAPPAQEPTPAKKKPKIEINFDLGGLLGGFFNAAAQAQQKAKASKEAADPSEAPTSSPEPAEPDDDDR